MEELLTCKYNRCNKFYKNPIRLPCIDYSICASHLNDLYINDSKTKILCCFCNIVHQIPAEGLKLNEDLNKLLNLNVHLIKSDKHREAKQLNLKSISIANEINDKIRESHNLLGSHFNEIRQKIEDQREKCKMQIDSIANEMLTELSNYEEDCKLNLIRNEILSDHIEINENWEDELRTVKLSERRLNDLLKEMKKFIKQNESFLNNLKNDLFLRKLCEFEPASEIRKNDKKTELFFGNLKIKPINSNTFTTKITGKAFREQFNDTIKSHLLNNKQNNHNVSSVSSSLSNLALNKYNHYDRNQNFSSNEMFDVMRQKFKLNNSTSKNNIYLSRSSTVSPKMIKKSSTLDCENESTPHLISPRTSRAKLPKNARV